MTDNEIAKLKAHVRALRHLLHLSPRRARDDDGGDAAMKDAVTPITLLVCGIVLYGFFVVLVLGTWRWVWESGGRDIGYWFFALASSSALSLVTSVVIDEIREAREDRRRG